eukprot:COSAG02_NODE_193_length_29843_cov_30.519903_23_plen_267_part_00
MDGVGAEPRAVRALEAWLRPPLIPWQALRQLQETQREIEALQRGDTKSGSAEERAWSSRFSAGDGVVVVPSEQLSDGRCTVCNAGLWGRAESFVASVQRELPSLERPRWLPRVPRASAHLVANSNEYVPDTPAPSRIRHEKGTGSNENPRLEPEPEPRLAPTGNNRSKLHFHTMPGSWEMKRWGAAPEGYCWCAPRSRHTTSASTAVCFQGHLQLHGVANCFDPGALRSTRCKKIRRTESRFKSLCAAFVSRSSGVFQISLVAMSL